MPKCEVDWSVLDESFALPGNEIPPLAEVYKHDVSQEIGRIEALMRATKKSGGKLGTKLVSFAANSDPEDYVIRASAMYGVLRRAGVLDAYFDPTRPEGRHVNTESGWEITLTVPRRRGIFLVRNQVTLDPNVDRHTAYFRVA